MPEKSIKKIQSPKYINPIVLLGLTEKKEVGRNSIRKATKRLQAEISLSDGQAVNYKGHEITSSTLHEIESLILSPESIDCHLFIASEPSLLAFFEEAKLSQELQNSLKNRPSIHKLIPHFFANSYSIAYLAALQVWNIEELKLLKSLSRFIDPTYIDEAYGPSEKHILGIASKIKNIEKQAQSKSEIEPQQIKDSLKELLFDSKRFDLAVIPSEFDNELDSVAGSLHALGVLMYNKFGNLKFAKQLIRGAKLLSKSPSLVSRIEEDLKSLCEAENKIEEREKTFRNEITNVLETAYESVSKNGGDNVNLSKLNEMLIKVFSPEVITAIKKDKIFLKTTQDHILHIIRSIGFNNSAKIVFIFRTLFEDDTHSHKELVAALEDAKKADFKEKEKKPIGGILLLVGLFLGIGGVVFFVYISEQLQSPETEQNNATIKEQKQSNSHGKGLKSDHSIQEAAPTTLNLLFNPLDLETVQALFRNLVNNDGNVYEISELKITEGLFSRSTGREALIHFQDKTESNLNYLNQLWLLTHDENWTITCNIANGVFLSFDSLDVDGDGLFEFILQTVIEQPGQMHLEVATRLIAFKSNSTQAEIFETRSHIPHYSTGRAGISASPLFSDVDNDGNIEIVNIIDTADISYTSFWRLTGYGENKNYNRVSFLAEKGSAKCQFTNEIAFDSETISFAEIVLLADSLNDSGELAKAFCYYLKLEETANTEEEKIRAYGSLAQLSHTLNLNVTSQKYCKKLLEIAPKSNWAKKLVTQNLAKYHPFSS